HYTEDVYDVQISVLESSKFWATIFLASGNTEKLHSHFLAQETRKIVINIAKLIAEKSITIGLLEEILKIFMEKDNLFIELINSAVGDQDELVLTNSIIDTLHH
ncbi:5219_t:CDS:1, partial [Acaulospora colombiana]